MCQKTGQEGEEHTCTHTQKCRLAQPQQHGTLQMSLTDFSCIAKALQPLVHVRQSNEREGSVLKLRKPEIHFDKPSKASSTYLFLFIVQQAWFLLVSDGWYSELFYFS
jgi:hypothetical protein